MKEGPDVMYDGHMMCVSQSTLTYKLYKLLRAMHGINEKLNRSHSANILSSCLSYGIETRAS